MIGALREAEFGNHKLAIRQVSKILQRDSSQEVSLLAALALARAREQQQMGALVHALHQRFPKDTLMNEYWLPSIRAAAELQKDNPSQAIETLETARRYELASPPLQTNVLLYPVYLRGEAYLAAALPDKAATEFQKIVDHSGLAGNYLLAALAHLGLGRAYAMEAGVPVMPAAGAKTAERSRSRTSPNPDVLAKARSAYQDFFALWKDADPNIPLIERARMEYRKLQ